MNRDITVRFFFEYKPVSLKNRNRLKNEIQKLCKKEGKILESLNYVFVSDEYLLKLNKGYLKHDYYTDIITFGFSEGKMIGGEIYISVERVRENAILHGQSFTRELHRVVFHGALHLCGYKDKTKKEASLMRTKEDSCLAAYFKHR